MKTYIHTYIHTYKQVPQRTSFEAEEEGNAFNPDKVSATYAQTHMHTCAQRLDVIKKLSFESGDESADESQ